MNEINEISDIKVGDEVIYVPNDDEIDAEIRKLFFGVVIKINPKANRVIISYSLTAEKKLIYTSLQDFQEIFKIVP